MLFHLMPAFTSTQIAIHSPRQPLHIDLSFDGSCDLPVRPMTTTLMSFVLLLQRTRTMSFLHLGRRSRGPGVGRHVLRSCADVRATCLCTSCWRGREGPGMTIAPTSAITGKRDDIHSAIRSRCWNSRSFVAKNRIRFRKQVAIVIGLPCGQRLGAVTVVADRMLPSSSFHSIPFFLIWKKSFAHQFYAAV